MSQTATVPDKRNPLTFATPSSHANDGARNSRAIPVRSGWRLASARTAIAIEAAEASHHSPSPTSFGSAASGRQITAINGGDSSGTDQKGGLIHTQRSPGAS